MSKVLLIIGLTALFSCSEDKVNIDESSFLPKRIVFSDSNRQRTYTFEYVEDKIQSVNQRIESFQYNTTQNYTVTFDYAETNKIFNVIISSDQYVTSSEISFMYGGEFLEDIILETYYLGNVEYSYQNIGNQKKVTCMYSNSPQWSRDYLYDENMNCIKVTNTNNNNGSVGVLFEFEHDNYKNPFCNIRGLDKLIDKSFFEENIDDRIILESGKNNINRFRWAGGAYQEFNYVYNDQGYPISATTGNTQIKYYY